MVANGVGHLSEAAFHHPEMLVTYSLVTVALQTHSANGLTEKDFELAAKIEEFLMWQPGKASGTLEGVPDNPSFKYLEYD